RHRWLRPLIEPCPDSLARANTKPVIPTEASRRPLFAFAPANASARAAEESLFDLNNERHWANCSPKNKNGGQKAAILPRNLFFSFLPYFFASLLPLPPKSAVAFPPPSPPSPDPHPSYPQPRLHPPPPQYSLPPP